MTIEAELYDGTVLEFPDGTADFVIRSTVKTQTEARRQAKREAGINSLRARNPAEYDPTSPEFAANYGPVAGNSFAQNAQIGAGKMFTDVGLGAQQIVGAAPASAAADKRATDAAIMGTAGGKVGYGGAAMLSAAPLMMAGGASIPSAALAGGIFGALQPAESTGERYLNAGTGAGYSAIGQYGLNRLIPWLGSYPGKPQPGITGLTSEGAPVFPSNRVTVPENFVAPTPEVRASYAPTGPVGRGPSVVAGAQSGGVSSANASLSANPSINFRQQTSPSFGELGPDPSAGLTSTQARVLKDAESLGFRVTPGVKAGSKVLQQQEAKMESQPWSSGPFFNIKNGNIRRGNQIAAEAIGAKSDVVDDVVLQRTDARLGRIYEKVADDRVRSVNPDDFIGRLAEIEDEFSGLLQNNMSVADHPLVRQLFDLTANGNVTGRQAQNISSKLGRAIRTNMTSANGDRELGLALIKVKDLADDILAQGLDNDTASLFKTARQQYRTLKMLEASNVTNASSGNVSLANLANMLARVDKKGFMYGRNTSDLYTAARFAQAFRPLVGDSGTATRSPFGTSLTDIAIGIPVNVAARAYTSNAATAAAGAAARGANAARAAAGPAMSAADAAATNAGFAAGQYLPFGLPGVFSTFGPYLRD